jgi:hypothetical protein
MKKPASLYKKKHQTLALTVEEIEAIRDQAARPSGESFTAEEMQAIREQFVQRLEEESKKREDLEWRLRLAIARLRDVASATDKLRAIQDSLRGVLGEVDEGERTQPLVRRVRPPAIPARALRKDFKRVIA